MKRTSPVSSGNASKAARTMLSEAEYRAICINRFHEALASCSADFIVRSDDGEDLQPDDACYIRTTLSDAGKTTHIYKLAGERADMFEGDDGFHTMEHYDNEFEKLCENLSPAKAAHVKELVADFDDLMLTTSDDVLDDLCGFESLEVPFDFPMAVALCRVNHYEKIGAAALEDCVAAGSTTSGVAVIKARFEKTLARNLRVAVNGGTSKLAKYAQKRALTIAEKGAIKEDAEGAVDLQRTEAAMEAYYAILDDDEEDTGRSLVEELDACLQLVVDETLAATINELKTEVRREATRCAEKASTALFRANSRYVDGGRAPNESIVSFAEWENTLKRAMNTIESIIADRFGGWALAMYKDGVYHINTARYHLETQIKPPAIEPRCTHQLLVRLRQETEKIVARFAKRIEIIQRVEAYASERKGSGTVSKAEWDDLIMEGTDRAITMVMQNTKRDHVRIPMSATIQGMLCTVVKTPEQRPSLTKEDFEHLIFIVVPQAVADVCDELSTINVITEDARKRSTTCVAVRAAPK